MDQLDAEVEDQVLLQGLVQCQWVVILGRHLCSIDLFMVAELLLVWVSLDHFSRHWLLLGLLLEVLDPLNGRLEDASDVEDFKLLSQRQLELNDLCDKEESQKDALILDDWLVLLAAGTRNLKDILNVLL